MSDLEKRFEKLMTVVEDERKLRKQAEDDLAAAKQAADLAAATAAAQLANANAVAAAATTKPKKPKMSLPSKFDGTRGEKAEAWVRQIGVYMMSHPDEFTDDRTKVMWTLSFLEGPALAWSQQFSDKLFLNEEVKYQDDFAVAFTAMYFDPEKKPKAEAALRKLKQTKSVSDYTHQFNIHANYAGWEVETLISQYKQEFKTLAEISNLSLKIDNELNGTEVQATQSTSTAPAADPNAMDLSAMNGRLSDAEKARMMRTGQCFRCGTRGHLARDCPEKNGKGKRMRDVPILSSEGELFISLGASRITKRNENDPRLFVTLTVSPTTTLRATSTTQNPPLLFLIDSGATHDVISESYARANDLLRFASHSERTISGFDGSTSRASYQVELHLEADPTPTTFIITTLKDSYSGILGMPWLRQHGHRIDWHKGQFRPATTTIAALEEASSTPKTPSDESPRPQGTARIIDEGVYASDAPTLPQCKLATLPFPTDHEATGKHVSFTEIEQASETQDMTKTQDPTIINPFARTCRLLGGRRSSTIEAAAEEGGPEVAARSELTLKPTTEDARLTNPFARTCRLFGGRRPSTIEAAAEEGGPEVAARSELTLKTTTEDTKLRKGDDQPRGQKRQEVSPTPIVCTRGQDANPVSQALSSATVVSKTVTPPSRTIDIASARTSWSTSAKISAEAKKDTKAVTAEELVPACYHGFIDMFHKKAAQRLPPRRQYDFRVELVPGATPQTSRPIPLSPAENQALQTMLEEGLSNGTIRRTTSPWAAPVLFTGKKDGNLRPCFDYRKLNSVTVKNRYPLPLTMELVDSLLHANTFTKLDLRNAYGNLRVAEGDEDKLAFVCKSGQFAPLTMPFGPTGAPGFFQYFMQDILVGRVGRDVAVYLDDILIYTQDSDDHQESVRKVLETLSKHQLWLKPEKCEFSRAEVEYLGLLISKNKVRMDPGKVTAVTEWPAPKNIRELQRFIGFANFYRRFIDHFSGIARPLHDLTKSNTEFRWDQRCQAAFNSLKTAFTSAPVLKIANPYEAFILECDCSDFALGAILSQISSDDGDLHPVAFLSRSLVQAERNYQIFDKELLAIVAAFKEWRHYLEGNPHRLNAIVYTDHRNLESFMTTKELTRRQARWAEIMGCFDFDIVFRPGRDSSKPDALSRRPDLAPDKADKLSFGQLLRPENIKEDTFTAIAEFDTWFEDESVDLDDAEHWFQVDVLGVDVDELYESPIWTDSQIMTRVRETTDLPPLTEKEARDSNRQYSQADGVYYTRGRAVVPDDTELRREIVRSRHDSKLAGHPGRARTLALVQRCFTWPAMRKFIYAYVDGCDSCQRVKPVTQKPFGTLEPLPIPAGPWTDISYDLITDLPESNSYNCILTVVDRLTKMAHFIPCTKELNASGLADLMLRHVWKLHGTPKSIVSDRGSIFVSQLTKELDKRLGIKLHPSTAYHPRTDGQSEIVNKAVEQYIRHFVCYRQDDWEPLLATAEFTYNNNEHTATGVSPFKANYGYEPTYGGIPSSEQCLPEVEERLRTLSRVQDEVRQCLEEAQESMKRQFNRHVRKTPHWKEGDEVWLNSRNISTTRPTAKFEQRWLGPFPIQRVISNSVYKLTLPPSMKGVHPVFHVSMLRKYQVDTIEGRGRPEPQPVEVLGEEEWEVEEVLDCKGKGKRRRYLISWRGFGPAENSWEPESNLTNCQELLNQFKKRFPDAARKHKKTRRFK
ncbi:hypothetical protein MJO28_011451 [Puccinia striiformis f. sp. tritici]|uniref:Uncharacterized protein n=1 Tax=Puccinia striiformis f. sp. tritici TaxID=168172 RepID=A0ACC0E448_9BASI|nr:hypothetical protein MJO28_011451 [Puccinia striiformis f. sp. tritici]